MSLANIQYRPFCRYCKTLSPQFPAEKLVETLAYEGEYMCYPHCALFTTKQNQPQPTQGRKNDSDKLRYDLIPVFPLEKVAEVYTIGAKKYDDNNWRKGMCWGRVFAAMLRHTFAWWRGEKLDPQDGQHHLASVAWCALTLMEYEQFHLGEDDRAIQGRV